MTSPEAAPPLRSHPRWLAWPLGVVVALVSVPIVVWTALAIHYTAPLPSPVATGLSWVVVVTAAITLVRKRTRRRALIGLAITFVLTAAWFASIEPSNDRDWRPEVAVLPRIEFADDRITVHDLRNFEYRTTTDFDVRYATRTYDLTKLQGIDLIASYWAGDDIAHTMLSWDFGDDDVLCVSVEVRREQGEGWGGLPGLFKQFEVIYVVADERDLVRLRTNYRHEDVYVFPLASPTAAARELLVEVLKSANALRERPEFYGTLARNCTTVLIDHVYTLWPERRHYGTRTLLNGQLPAQLYERGSIRGDVPFAEYKMRCRVNDAANAAASAPDFSRRIRASLPPRR